MSKNSAKSLRTARHTKLALFQTTQAEQSTDRSPTLVATPRQPTGPASVNSMGTLNKSYYAYKALGKVSLRYLYQLGLHDEPVGVVGEGAGL